MYYTCIKNNTSSRYGYRTNAKCTLTLESGNKPQNLLIYCPIRKQIQGQKLLSTFQQTRNGNGTEAYISAKKYKGSK